MTDATPSSVVLITGASGFVGYHIARVLNARGYKLRALLRPPFDRPAVQRLIALGIEPVYGDLLQPDSYQSALKGARYVFHTGGIHRIWTPNPQLTLDTNITASRQLFIAARESGVEQFIFTSSIKSLGITRDGCLITEDTPYELEEVDGTYGLSKRFAEQELLALDSGSMQLKLLNPSAICGPGDLGDTPTIDLIRRFLNGRIKAALDTRMGLVDVRDVALAHAQALDHAQPRRQHLLCAENFTLDELFDLLNVLAGTHYRTWKIPYPLAHAIAWAGEGLSRLTGKAPPVSASSVRIAQLRPGYDGSRAAQTLGLSYLPIRQSLADTLTWLRNPADSLKGDGLNS